MSLTNTIVFFFEIAVRCNKKTALQYEKVQLKIEDGNYDRGQVKT